MLPLSESFETMATKLQSNATLLCKYLALKQPSDTVLLTYVWIDGQHGLRSKTKVLPFTPQSAADCPPWTFDGASAYLPGGPNVSDIHLLPVKLYADPFRGRPNGIVLCETVTWEGKPTSANSRHSCRMIMEAVATEHDPWFGIEQEYSLMEPNEPNRPLGWPTGGYPAPPGPYYCGVGTNVVYGRDVVEAHLRACLYAGVKIAGENAESVLSQWEFQVGPCKGVDVGDDLWMGRYLLYRVAEDFNVGVSFDPKLVPGDTWFGAGADTNFSTAAMRAPGGLAVIKEAMAKLEANHAKHITKYDPKGGADNRRRLTGALCTAPIDVFSYAVDSRDTSIRIPRAVALAGCGYLEDRRPASNCDPYKVAEMLVRTICLDKEPEGGLGA